jgi:hypothetical protein
MSFDVAAFVSTNVPGFTHGEEDNDVGRMVFRHPKPIKFINMNTRTIWHEKLKTPAAWNDAWTNRMDELPIRKVAIENTAICESFKEKGFIKK